jgi:hypothetical protein
MNPASVITLMTGSTAKFHLLRVNLQSLALSAQLLNN